MNCVALRRMFEVRFTVVETVYTMEFILITFKNPFISTE
jgi:hypothetical protein